MSTDSHPAELPTKYQDENNDSCKIDITQENVTIKTNTEWFCEDCIAKDVNIVIKPLPSLNENKCQSCHATLNCLKKQDSPKHKFNSKTLPIPIHNTIFRTSLLNAVGEKLKTLNKKKGRSILRIDFTVECINPDTLKPNDMVSVNVEYVNLTSMQDLTYVEYCELFGCDEHVKRIKDLFRKKEGDDPDVISKDEDSIKVQNMTYEEYCNLFGCNNHIKRLRNIFPKNKFSLKECLSSRMFPRTIESKNVSQKKPDKLIDNDTQSKSKEPGKKAEDSTVVYYHPPDNPKFALLVQQVKERKYVHYVKEVLDDPEPTCSKCRIKDKIYWIPRLQLLFLLLLVLIALSVYFGCKLYFLPC